MRLNLSRVANGDSAFARTAVFGFLLLLLLPSDATANADTRFQPIAREMRHLVAEQTVPSIVVAVAKDGRIIWEFAVGWADRERQIPATPDTPYSLASVSKPFTATAVLKLVEAGRLALDSPANNYLGHARITGTHPERATLRHVLTHTAGLPAYFRMRFADDAQTFENTIASRAILTRPSGRRYLYSNLGYGILDHIIERVAGVTYAEFMHRELFEPLQLGQTSVPTASQLGAAVRYSADDSPLPFYDVDHRGASSVYASAHDLVRFGMFHLNDGASEERRTGQRILQAKSIREMQRVHTHIETGAGYGLGWRIDDDGRGFRQVGHTGGMPGVTTVLSLFPAERVVVVVLANRRSDLVVPLARRVAGAVIPAYAWRLRQELHSRTRTNIALQLTGAGDVMSAGGKPRIVRSRETVGLYRE
jgi:CubicO group peptidase (beta-lactamase class C family)